MFQYRQVLVRLRAGDTVREIARSGLMGRDKLAALRAVAERLGWLEAGAQVPDDASIAAALAELGKGQRASSTISSVEPHRDTSVSKSESTTLHKDPRQGKQRLYTCWFY